MSMYLTRNKIYLKREPFKDAKKVYIFTEGSSTELEYFRYFIGISSNINIITIPNVEGKSDPEKLKENAQKLFFSNIESENKYTLQNEFEDEVWFVIDTDRWNEKGKIEILKEFVNIANKENPAWFVAQSNPCFEVWLYYHIHSVKPRIDEVEKFIGFKEFLNDKVKGGFNKRTMPIAIQNAITNSKSNFQMNKNNQPDIFSTDVYKLGDVILKFVKHEIDKYLLKQK